MPTLTTNEAAERLANVVENTKSATLTEIYAELFPESPAEVTPSAKDVAKIVRNGLEAEALVDLWNVIFPADRNVWFDEEGNKIHYNEESLGYAEAD